MYIRKIELSNFGPHRHLELELTQGLVGIVGPNGSGKSHITDGIHAALTNDFGRFEGQKQDNICDLADTSDRKTKSYIYLELEHGGSEIRLYRGLKPQKQWLTVDGGDALTRQPDIQHELEERLGLSRKVLDSHILIPQWEMFSFLAETPAERARSYQQLCGTLHAQVVRDAIQEMLKSDSTFNETVEDNSDEIRQRRAERKRERDQAAGQLDEAHKGVLADETRQRAGRVIQAFERRQELVRRRSGISDQLERARQQESNALQEVNNAKAEYDDLEEQRARLEPEAEKARQALAQFDRYQRDRDRRENLEQQLAQLDRETQDNPQPGLHGEDDRREEYDQARQRARSNREAFETQARQLESSSTVTCQAQIQAYKSTDGQTGYDFRANNRASDEDTVESAQQTLASVYDDLVQQLGDPQYAETLRKRAEDARSEEQYYARLVTEIDEAREALEEWEKWRVGYEERRRSVREQLDQLADLQQPEGDREELQQTDTQFRDLKNRVQHSTDRLHRARNNLTRAQSGRENFEKDISDIDGELENLQVTRQSYDNANKALKRNEEAVQEVARLGERVQALDRSIDEDDRELQRLAARQERSRRARDFRDRLEKVDRVMHHQALPQVVARENLSRMEADINRTLQHFGSPFWVQTTEDLSFQVHFPGAPPRRAERLSGGQKVILAVAFRTAVSTLFGAEVGMMALDEPSVGLDEENVQYLAEALTGFAGEIRDRRQVLMITHARDLMSAFDRVIDLGNQ